MTTAGEQIAERMRARIVEGRWRPGNRLPKRTELIRELDSSALVVQEAVNQLAAEGFVEVGARRQGTRVVEHPPHLSRYRLIFPFSPANWGQFWHALEDAAAEQTTPTRQFAYFYGLSGHRDIADFQAIVDEVRTRSVAGLIFASSMTELRGTPLLDAPGVPRVAIATPDQLPGIPKVCMDLEHFVQQAVAHLAKQGRRRIAILCASRAAQMVEPFRAALVAHGLQAPSHWEQFASMKNREASRCSMELLFHAGQAQRPDGLIIADDNLIAGATEGIANAGVRTPDELSVVAMTNFPHVLPAAVPVTRLGYDVPAILDLLTSRVAQLAEGSTPPEVTTVKAVFETEYASSPTPRTDTPGD